MEYMLTRLEWLVGPDKIQTLKDTSIALFGIGGVGGGALEALVRAGVGRIVIIDGDSICTQQFKSSNDYDTRYHWRT